MSTPPQAGEPAFLVFDIETVPDGELIRKVKFASDKITPEEAIARTRQEVLDRSGGKTDFLPVTYCYPVATCVARVSSDFRLQAITCLDSPQFRPREMVADFWRGLARYHAALISFNGRGFDLPVMELAAFRFGIGVRGYFNEKFGRRYRYSEAHLDLNDWLSNHGACPITGGLDLLSKILGKPGKFSISGRDVYDMFRAGKVREINDYCMFDVLDTYFVFLRTRVLAGELTLEQEQERVVDARNWIESNLEKLPHLSLYLENWGDWEPWV